VSSNPAAANCSIAFSTFQASSNIPTIVVMASSIFRTSSSPCLISLQ
jgi:hypothetical protein